MDNIDAESLHLEDYLDADDAERVRAAMNAQATDRHSHGSKVRVMNPRRLQKLGFWTVICTVLNRAIGIRFAIHDDVLVPNIFVRYRHLCDSSYSSESDCEPRCSALALDGRSDYKYLFTPCMAPICSVDPKIPASRSR